MHIARTHKGKVPKSTVTTTTTTTSPKKNTKKNEKEIDIIDLTKEKEIPKRRLEEKESPAKKKQKREFDPNEKRLARYRSSPNSVRFIPSM
jgi:hypothetical protein